MSVSLTSILIFLQASIIVFSKLSSFIVSGMPKKFNAIMTIVLLVLQYLDFQAFNLFLHTTTHKFLDS